MCAQNGTQRHDRQDVLGYQHLVHTVAGWYCCTMRLMAAWVRICQHTLIYQILGVYAWVWEYICLCVQDHMCAHSCVLACMFICTSIFLYMCRLICASAHLTVCVHAHPCICIYIPAHLCLSMSAHWNVWTSMCLCICASVCYANPCVSICITAHLCLGGYAHL